jgi:hypothetical protein
MKKLRAAFYHYGKLNFAKLVKEGKLELMMDNKTGKPV